MWLTWSLVGCKAVDPAPAALDDLLHWLWRELDEGEDKSIAEGFANLDAAVGGGGLEPTDGTVSRLSSAEAAIVGVTDRDPVLAPGIFLVNAFDCDWGQLETILSYDQQDALYDDVYVSYGRTFDTPRTDWLDGASPRLDYDIAYAATLLGATYEADARGVLRRFEAADGLGPFLLQRSHLVKPGQFEGDVNKSMDQDYQLEAYWVHKGRIYHVYGMWRQADFGSGFGMEDEGSQRLLLNNLFDWDDNTAVLCAEGRP